MLLGYLHGIEGREDLPARSDRYTNCNTHGHADRDTHSDNHGAADCSTFDHAN
jgi:hypothetical protein